MKSISGNSLIIASDAGGEITVSVADSTRLLQLEPGQKDLKAALSVQLNDFQPGDRVLANGKLSPDGKALDALRVIVMKQTSIAQKQQQEREDWQKNSLGGLVKESDPATGTITITVGAGPASKSLLVHTTKNTIVRRYAPNSVKFDDARKSQLTEIKPGDQLRVRGTRNADGTEFTAQEIVSGAFKNIAGTVQSANGDEKTLTVLDLATKKPVVVRVTADSQMHQLPPMMAEHIAMRLKGTTPPTLPAGTTPSGASRPGAGWTQHGGPGAPGSANGGPPDMQRMLARTPPVNLVDLKKGDAVMIVATEGTAEVAPTAITLLSGVEPILTASPDGARGMTLSAWSLDAGGGAEAAAQ